MRVHNYGATAKFSVQHNTFPEEGRKIVNE
jgi:hypothetical protein